MRAELAPMPPAAMVVRMRWPVRSSAEILADILASFPWHVPEISGRGRNASSSEQNRALAPSRGVCWRSLCSQETKNEYGGHSDTNLCNS